MTTRQRRRVLIVTASAARRGAETQASQLTESLIASGIDARIVALSLGDRTHRLPIEPLGPSRLAPSTLWRLRKAARECDVVIAYGSTTLPASIFALAGSSIPLVYRSVSDPARWLRGPLHRRVTAWQYQRPDRIAALWPAAGASIIETFGVDPERLVTVPNARSGEHYRPPSDRERRTARNAYRSLDGPLVAVIGSLTNEKRLALAIETIAELDGVYVVVAGSGPEEEMVRTLATRLLGGRATFLGAVDDVRSVLFAADALLMTSEVEGMPGVAIEAALCGLPVVATSVGALSTMPGVTVRPADALALAEALTDRLAAGGARPEDSGADQLTWPVVTSSWLAVLDEVLGAELPPRAPPSDEALDFDC